MGEKIFKKQKPSFIEGRNVTSADFIWFWTDVGGCDGGGGVKYQAGYGWNSQEEGRACSLRRDG